MTTVHEELKVVPWRLRFPGFRYVISKPESSTCDVLATSPMPVERKILTWMRWNVNRDRR